MDTANYKDTSIEKEGCLEPEFFKLTPEELYEKVYKHNEFDVENSYIKLYKELIEGQERFIETTKKARSKLIQQANEQKGNLKGIEDQIKFKDQMIKNAGVGLEDKKRHVSRRIANILEIKERQAKAEFERMSSPCPRTSTKFVAVAMPLSWTEYRRRFYTPAFPGLVYFEDCRSILPGECILFEVKDPEFQNNYTLEMKDVKYTKVKKTSLLGIYLEFIQDSDGFMGISPFGELWILAIMTRTEKKEGCPSQWTHPFLRSDSLSSYTNTWPTTFMYHEPKKQLAIEVIGVEDKLLVRDYQGINIRPEECILDRQVLKKCMDVASAFQ